VTVLLVARHLVVLLAILLAVAVLRSAIRERG